MGGMPLPPCVGELRLDSIPDRFLTSRPRYLCVPKPAVGTRGIPWRGMRRGWGTLPPSTNTYRGAVSDNSPCLNRPLIIRFLVSRCRARAAGRPAGPS
ncbi:uncharacterized protein SCHCODRAFT_02006084 [Schizophyllum commune H4-8]|uniref:uncharacterized protein n=1 Tax=Schizophyllum commune (strain H4-8 / FGSC 9210) TaxID=578458 RepID=UPI00215FE5B8|nr:uncharacterized protein SCHCODRAFT_02006084 [Schizophyllum commune H4-8]KAI5899228.1 hypothetical protein SCHCODRAFT_02006084 [Schizophyllum commune H4-8]